MNKILFVIILFISSFVYADGVPENWIGPEHLIEENSFGEYEVKIYRHQEFGYPGMLHVLKDDEVVYEEEGNLFHIGLMYEAVEHRHPFQNGTDITGDGNANLVVSQWSGGAHCCYDYRVFSLGKNIELLDFLEVNDASGSYFKDLNHDGKLEFISSDYTYAYWNTSFVRSPVPKIILKFTNEGYKLAPELMKKPIDKASDYSELRESFQFAYDDLKNEGECKGWSKEDVCVLPDVWSHMIYLIYAGHYDEAWKFLDTYWTHTEEAKQWFLHDLKSKLVASWYYPVLKDDLFGYENLAVGRQQEYFNKVADYYFELEEKEEVAEAESEDSGTGVTTVQEVQEMLRAKGYDPSMDGKLDSQTRDAIAEFQEDNDLEVNRFVDKLTWEKLNEVVRK